MKMANSSLKRPKKKKRCHESIESPLPVPVASLKQQKASNTRWFYYSGDLVDDHVVVEHTGDMNYLYRMGFFGKGTLSRSGPEYNKIGKFSKKHHSGDKAIRIIPKRKYFNHLRWSREKEGIRTSLSDSGSYNIFGSPQLHVQEQPSSNIKSTADGDYGDNDSSNDSVKLQEETWESDTGSDPTDIFMGAENSVQSSYDMAYDSSVEQAELRLKPDTEPVDHHDQLKHNSQWSDKDSASFWGIDNSKEGWGFKDVETGRGRTVTDGNTWDETDKKKADKFWNSSDHEASWDNESQETIDDNFWSSEDKEASLFEFTETKNDEAEKEVNELVDLLQTDDYQKSQSDSNSVLSKRQQEKMISPRKSNEGSNDVIDPRSEVDDPDGDVLVVPDSGSDDEDENMGVVKKMKWRPCIKRDPFKVREHLQLSLEEAFFLSFGLGCLLVYDSNKKPMNLCQMWQTFCSLEKNFLPNYIVYHNLRSKGWVPKTGLKYGADFIVYKDGPLFYHSSYSVLVRMVSEQTLQQSDYDDVDKTRQLTWPSLAGINRITEKVGKELMFCFVIRPSRLADEDFLSPNCIKLFKVQELIMKRWISSRERDEEEDHFP